MEFKKGECYEFVNGNGHPFPARVVEDAEAGVEFVKVEFVGGNDGEIRIANLRISSLQVVVPREANLLEEQQADVRRQMEARAGTQNEMQRLIDAANEAPSTQHISTPNN